MSTTRPGEDPEPFRISRGLPEDLRHDAAALYLEAFSRKLGPVLGRDDRARAFLARVIRPDHAIVAIDTGGRLLGLAGFHDQSAGFVGGSLRDLAAHYGWPGALWRAALLSFFEREAKPGVLLMDGIAVAPDARGRGVGRALLTALANRARANGENRIQLDVVDTNPRARALYERNGFTAAKHQRTAPFTLPLGFGAVTTMVRDLT